MSNYSSIPLHALLLFSAKHQMDSFNALLICTPDVEVPQGERESRKPVKLTRWGTGIASIRMNAGCFTTFWTAVLFFLVVEEFLHSMGLNEIQILNYAHFVFFRIAILKLLKMNTGIICAFKTELDLILVNEVTILLEKGTSFVPSSASRAGMFSLRTTHGITKKCDTCSAVISTRGNQLWFHHWHV